MLDLVAEVNSTVMFSSHIVPDVERVATDIIILHEGRVILQMPMDRLHEEVRLLECRPFGAAWTQLQGNRDVLSLKRSDGKTQALVSCGSDGMEQWLLTNAPAVKEADGLSIRALGLEDLFIRLTEGYGR